MPKLKDLKLKRTIASDLPVDAKASHRNIEVKFRCGKSRASLGDLRKRAIQLGAKFRATLWQMDTYFNARVGRLKLREHRGGHAELIAYSRSNARQSRASDYRVVPVPDPAALKSALTDALGIRSVVRKRRDLFLYKNVRIHLDRVDNLGDFGELEAVIGRSADSSAEVSRRRIRQVIYALGITSDQMLSHSYGEMVKPSVKKTPVVRKTRRQAL